MGVLRDRQPRCSPVSPAMVVVGDGLRRRRWLVVVVLVVCRHRVGLVVGVTEEEEIVV